MQHKFGGGCGRFYFCFLLSQFQLFLSPALFGRHNIVAFNDDPRVAGRTFDAEDGTRLDFGGDLIVGRHPEVGSAGDDRAVGGLEGLAPGINDEPRSGVGLEQTENLQRLPVALWP